MAEPQAAPSPAPAQAPATPTPEPQPQGLEKVYKDFNIEAEAATFKPEPPAAPAPAPAVPKVPDPFDPNFPAYQAQLAQGLTALSQATTQMQGQFTALQQELGRRQVEADIKQAVGILTEKTGLDPDIAEVALESKARKDPKFLQIWNNRTKNPKAFQAALEAVSGEFKDRFSVKQDPQLVENQRAIRASQQQMAVTQRTSEQDKWAEMTPAEREAERNRIRRSGM